MLNEARADEREKIIEKLEKLRSTYPHYESAMIYDIFKMVIENINTSKEP